jgi:phosphopantothenoylcysteine decarboxylase/phosphopantothenate--cysteine ligase
MSEACKARYAGCDAAIMSAAVADWRPAGTATEKIKKTTALESLPLEATEDILAWMGASKKQQKLVGFALETTDEVKHAEQKLDKKNLDLLVLNSLKDEGAGFGHDTNKVTLLSPGTKPEQLPLMSKAQVAAAILDRLETLFPDA